MQELLTRLFPLASINATQEPTLTVSELSGLKGDGTLNDLRIALKAVDTQCRKLNRIVSSARLAIKCLGVLPEGAVFRPEGRPFSRYTGLSIVGGISGVVYKPASIDNLTVRTPYEAGHWLTPEAKILGHEFGHLLNLNHGACGNTRSVDSRLAADGLMHGEGWDRTRNLYFSSDAGDNDTFSDLMSYCDKGWMSVPGYQASLRYRAGTGSSARLQGDIPRWVEIDMTGGRWRVRASTFTPGRLGSSKLTARAGERVVPVFSAVFSEGDGDLYGPWYAEIGGVVGNVLQLEAPGQSAVTLVLPP